MDLKRECIRTLVRYLENILEYLDKGVRHAQEREEDFESYLGERLVPDQFDLLHQVQYAYFTALEIGERLSDIAPPEFTYKEKTLDEVRDCVNRTMEYLRSLTESTELVDFEREVETYLLTYPVPLREYLFHFGLPNFFFHTTLTYEILRKKGVPLGKDDFIGV